RVRIPPSPLFFLWGESSEPFQIKHKGHLSKASTRQPRLHPFQTIEKDIYGIIESLDLPSDSEKAHPENVLLLLPSFSSFPQASPELLREGEGEEEEKMSIEEKLELILWKLNGFVIPPEYAVKMLISLSEVWAVTNDLVIGTDLRFWRQASKFVIGLLSKQHFIPDIVVSEDKEGEGFARWQYVLYDSAERNHMSMLTRSMPSICRAIKQNASPISSEALLSDFLNATLDDCIRNWIPSLKKAITKSGLSKVWLKSLTTGEMIKTSKPRFQKLSEGLHSWIGSIEDRETPTFRTCFRLEPPPSETNLSETWDLRYFLQAADDPSLLVPAETVWSELSDTLEFLNRKFNHPQEKLLEDLGKASQLCPSINSSLLSARPVTAKLTTQEAYIFLKETAPLLQESGFGVLVPSWWDKTGVKTARLGRNLDLKPRSSFKTSKSEFTLESIVEFDWQLAIGDILISESEFEKLALLKEPLVRVRGQWVELREEDITEAINFLKSKNKGELKLSEALQLSIGIGETSGLPINGYSASGWIASLLERLSGQTGIPELPQPDDFTGQLRPYQTKGYSWMMFMRQYGLGLCLADDMGLGKTIQMLALLLKEKEEGKEKPTLLICPTSIVGNWQRETTKFAPSLRVLIHHGSRRKKKEEFLTDLIKYDLVISTYALTFRDEDLFTEVEWNGVVLDEAQNIKNPHTKQAQAVRKFKSDFSVALTGTPIENRLSELWSIMEFLNTQYLGSATSFRREFALPIERYNNKEARTRLQSIVRPFILRRLKTDRTIIKDLPEKFETKVYCNLTKEQATLYKAVVQDMLKKIEASEGIARKGTVLSALMRLKQLCNHPALFLDDGSALAGRSGKLKRIIELLEEILAEGNAALVFTQFAKMGHLLKKQLQIVFRQEALFLHGGITQKVRDQMVVRFSKNDGPKIFILSLKAGGVGLNLTRANHVFHFDRWWNPAVENQATDRVFRIGQLKNVQVHKFICIGTLEERIDEIIEKKKILAENIIGTGEDWLTEMTTEDLRELFALRRE
ncbi:MAG: DEAD/DEAH box helicase, partial [Candidatus Hodarchaeota archaeon]